VGRIRFLAFLSILVVGAPLPLAAQDAGEAENTSVEYARHLSASDWDAAAAMMHPEALGQIRTLAELLTEMDPSGQAASMIFGSAGASLEGESDTEVFAAFLAFAMTQAGLAEAMASMRQDAVGHVAEGDTVHVVSRTHMSFEGLSVSQMNVSSLVRHEGAWRMLLTGEIEAFLLGLRQQLGVDSGPSVN